MNDDEPLPLRAGEECASYLADGLPRKERVGEFTTVRLPCNATWKVVSSGSRPADLLSLVAGVRAANWLRAPPAVA